MRDRGVGAQCRSTISFWRGWSGKAIAPSPEAGKTTLLRRVSLDLTGLPPTPEEVATFSRDTRPDAYERLVDRLLDSPHYGEKWARYWLDLARYADSDGYEKDLSRPWAWRYRQWVIDALNRDMPFDEFTIEQIAGDLLPNRNLDTLVATGFNRNTLTNREGGTDPEQFRDEQVMDRAATLGDGVAGADGGLRAVPQPQVRSRSARRSFTSSWRSSIRRKRSISRRRMPGELGPYLAAQAASTTASGASCWRSTRFPEAQADWEEQAARARSCIQGKHEDWDFAYGEFTHHGGQREEGAVHCDPAKRSEVQQNALTRCTS